MNIYQRIDHKLDKIEKKAINQAKKELIPERVEELARGKSLSERVIMCIKVLFP